MTPPKVLGTPKPASSVMISSTFGAPFGGTTRGAHHGLDCSAPSLITPPNFGSGGGNWVLGTVVVALGEPSVPVTCCAAARLPTTSPAMSPTNIPSFLAMVFLWQPRGGPKHVNCNTGQIAPGQPPRSARTPAARQ